MTDEQIKKALECCIESKNEGDCVELGCPYYLIEQCTKKNGKDALDLINRKDAEIERLQKANKSFSDLGKLYSEIKSEAYKEFAERLKGYAKELKIGDNIYLQVVGIGRIDNLLKELTEGGNEDG